MSVIKYNSKTAVINEAIYACGDDGVFYYPIFGKEGKVFIGDMHNKEFLLAIDSAEATAEMKEVALFNFVAYDNFKNPHKTGAYRLTSTQLKDAFSDAMFKVETGKMNGEAFKTFFALKTENRFMNECIDSIVKETVGKMSKTEDKAM
ncbi:MAG: hypothetical protein J6T39_00270 [Clostridia bacterium]|nr:hypothetical protein [Clostridia bacterium]